MRFHQPYLVAFIFYQLPFLADFVIGDNTKINATSGQVSCYVCNSDNEGQKDCESTDLDKLKPFLKPCPKLKEGPLAGTEANSCRKVLQHVDVDKININNVVRECGYTGTEQLDGKRKTGNSGITLKIWQCFNSDNNSPCNSALTSSMSLFTSIILFIIIFNSLS